MEQVDKDENNDFNKDMFKVQLQLLSWIGLKPNQHHKYAYLLCAVMQILRIIMMILAVMLAIKNPNLNSIIISVGSCQQFLQGVPVFILIKHENELHVMYKALNKYWIDEEMRSLNLIMQKVAFIGRRFCFVIFYVCLTIPIFWGKLAFPVYIPEFPYALYVIFVLQYLFFHYDVVVGMSNIYFYIAMSSILKHQFTILNDKYRTISEKQFKNFNALQETMKTYVKHHLLLLENSERLALIFNVALLVQYFVSALGAMTAMITLQHHDDMADLAFASSFLIVILGQLGLFCFPADILINEAEKTADAIYESAWCENKHYAKAYVQQIMVRAQKPITFSAGGLADINRTAYVQILKLAFTLYNFLNQLKRDRQ